MVSVPPPSRLATLTYPSGPPNPAAKPRGRPQRSYPKDDDETARSVMRENESSQVLARQGYDVEQRPRVPGNRNPDYLIEGRVFDNVAPKTSRAWSIWRRVERKVVKERPTSRVVINLNDSRVKLQELRQAFEDPIPGLEEVLIVRRGDVLRLFP